MSKRTYVTICTTTNYTMGVLLLKKSLEAVKSEYPLLCICPHKYSDVNTLKNNNIKVKIVEDMFAPNDFAKISNMENFDYWKETFFKLNIFGLIEYEKIIYIDADMLVLENIDDLFEKPHMTSCIPGKSFPGNEHWNELCSGLMIIEPSLADLHKLQSIFKNPVRKIYGDQDVINIFYSEWQNQEKLHLDESYGVFYNYIWYYSEILGYTYPGEGENSIRIVHYVGKYKPWMELPLTKRIKKALATLKHFKRHINYKNSILSKINSYYKKLHHLVTVTNLQPIHQTNSHNAGFRTEYIL